MAVWAVACVGAGSPVVDVTCAWRTKGNAAVVLN